MSVSENESEMEDDDEGAGEHEDNEANETCESNERSDPVHDHAVDAVEEHDAPSVCDEAEQLRLETQQESA